MMAWGDAGCGCVVDSRATGSTLQVYQLSTILRLFCKLDEGVTGVTLVFVSGIEIVFLIWPPLAL
jgi:hypothetical protein